MVFSSVWIDRIRDNFARYQNIYPSTATQRIFYQDFSVNGKNILSSQQIIEKKTQQIIEKKTGLITQM